MGKRGLENYNFQVFIGMKPIFTKEEFESSKSTDLLQCQCYYCDNTFSSMKKNIQAALNQSNRNAVKFCSTECKYLFRNKKIDVECSNCKQSFQKKKDQFDKTNNHFCSRSCAASFNNKNKSKGNRRSKLEIWLENQLKIKYPGLPILFNDKETICSELDIYVPSFRLAFELNGIFHYEPIFGQEKLNQIQENDKSKFKACLDAHINLCIIDTSQQKYFKEKTSKKYLDIITTIINQRAMLNS